VLGRDGWWPFHADGWQAEAMNAMVREIQPHILFNNRNAAPGDFTTPEQHITAPSPWRPWEACLTLNDTASGLDFGDAVLARQASVERPCGSWWRSDEEERTLAASFPPWALPQT
jgi:hypothetical protein